MTYQFRDETERFIDDDQEATVKVVGKQGDPYGVNERPRDWDGVLDDGPNYEADEIFNDPSNEITGSSYPTVSKIYATVSKMDVPMSPRAKIIAHGAELAYQALATFKLALNEISIVDIETHERYGKTLKALASAAEDFERKL